MFEAVVVLGLFLERFDVRAEWRRKQLGGPKGKLPRTDSPNKWASSLRVLVRMLEVAVDVAWFFPRVGHLFKERPPVVSPGHLLLAGYTVPVLKWMVGGIHFLQGDEARLGQAVLMGWNALKKLAEAKPGGGLTAAVAAAFQSRSKKAINDNAEHDWPVLPNCNVVVQVSLDILKGCGIKSAWHLSELASALSCCTLIGL